jgi:dTDP-4-dehydrorhamnose reductase
MKGKILLIGKNGQIGHALERELSAGGELTAVGREELDLTSPDAIRATIRSIKPQLIINAAAYTAVDRAETDEAAALALNATAPGVIAETGREIGAVLIHYSTDYVFDGKATSPYREEDETNPLNAYGRTKLAGENAIRDSGIGHFIFRTSWVYSTRGSNFLLTMLRLASRHEELRVVGDQIGAPTSSVAIASATARIVSNLGGVSGEMLEEVRRSGGIYHMTAGGATNWAEFAEAIVEHGAVILQSRNKPAWFQIATGGASRLAQRVIHIPSSQYPTPAERPAFSLLSNARLRSKLEVQLPDWREQLSRVFDAQASG